MPKTCVPWLAFLALIGHLLLVPVAAGELQSVPPAPAPVLSLADLQGRPLDLSALRGKVVLINFWASWCKPCEQEAAELQQAWAEFGPTGQVVFLGVDYVDTEPDARVYLQKFGIDFPNGPDMATRISQMFRTTGVPETYFIDQNGVLQYVKVGPFTSVGEIRAEIEKLLP